MRYWKKELRYLFCNDVHFMEKKNLTTWRGKNVGTSENVRGKINFKILIYFYFFFFFVRRVLSFYLSTSSTKEGIVQWKVEVLLATGVTRRKSTFSLHRNVSLFISNVDPFNIFIFFSTPSLPHNYRSLFTLKKELFCSWVVFFSTQFKILRKKVIMNVIRGKEKHSQNRYNIQ